MKTANNNTATTVTPYRTQPEYTKHKATILRLAGAGLQFNAGAVLEGDEGRQDCGSMVPGPWAYTFGLCIVIHNGSDEMKAREKADEDARTVEVKAGDLLEIDGHTYCVEVFNSYLNLIAV